jgi:hypothetical protein
MHRPQTSMDFLEHRTMNKAQNPVISSVTHHRQNPLEYNTLWQLKLVLTHRKEK